MSIREFVHYSLKCFHLGIVSHLKILPLKANVDFPRVFLSSFFFLTYTLVTLSLHWAVTQLWLQSGPDPQTVTVNQSIMTSGKVKQTTVTTATNSASQTLTGSTSLTCLTRDWPQRHKGNIAWRPQTFWSPVLETAENKRRGWLGPRGLYALFK